ncbi:MAG TPA: hypothetical protein VI457_02115 [Methylococcaceae bacterium]|nr:hypothetical protein [Methylococcaceae bacterium]
MRSFIFPIFALVLSGCIHSGAPECADEQVKALVRQLMVDQIKDFLAPEVSGIGFAKYARMGEGYRERIDALLAEVSVVVGSVRTQGQDDKIRKSSCLADVSIVTESQDLALARVANTHVGISYFAQYDDEGSRVVVQLAQ